MLLSDDLSPLINRLYIIPFVFLILLPNIVFSGSIWSSPNYSVSGSVEGGKYLYYTLEVSGHPKSLLVHLISHTGDCDLYVASKGMGQASYNNYIAKSDSCGVDQVELVKYLPRPFSVAVYGHPTHSINNCTLMVYTVNLPEDDYEIIEKAYNGKFGKSYEELTTYFQTYDHSSQLETDNKQDIHGAKSRDSRKSQSKSRTMHSDDDEMPSSFLSTLLLHLLEIIFDILL